jgi:hypothetical protein
LTQPERSLPSNKEVKPSSAACTGNDLAANRPAIRAFNVDRRFKTDIVATPEWLCGVLRNVFGVRSSCKWAGNVAFVDEENPPDDYPSADKLFPSTQIVAQ